MLKKVSVVKCVDQVNVSYSVHLHLIKLEVKTPDKRVSVVTHVALLA